MRMTTSLMMVVPSFTHCTLSHITVTIHLSKWLSSLVFSTGRQFSPQLHRSYSSVSALSTGSASARSFRTKYEPLRSVHADIQDVFLKPRRKLYSRGHEIPEPSFRPPSRGVTPDSRQRDKNERGKSKEKESPGSLIHSPCRGTSRGSSHFSTTSRNNANITARPHTSGTHLPSEYSPIRPTDRAKQLFTRATSPTMLRHGE